MVRPGSHRADQRLVAVYAPTTGRNSLPRLADAHHSCVAPTDAHGNTPARIAPGTSGHASARLRSNATFKGTGPSRIVRWSTGQVRNLRACECISPTKCKTCGSATPSL